MSERRGRTGDHTGEGGGRPVAKMATIGIAAAAALVPLNSTMIAVALPRIAEDFEISTGRTGVLITAYLVVMLVVQPVAGRLGDVIGSRLLVIGGLTGVIVFSALAAASTTFLLLVVARVAQAVFAAALSPGVQSLLREVTPVEHQGHAFGLLGSVIAAGAATGPVIGGLATQLFDWHSIFLLNVPVAGVALLAVRGVAPTARTGLGRVDRAPEGDDEVRDGRPPAVTGRIANRAFVAAFGVQALATAAQYSLLLLVPIVLDARGWGTGSIGLVLSALTVGMVAVGPRGGRLGDRRGRRQPTVVGLAVATVGLAILLVDGPATAIVLVVVALGVFGLGLGVSTPNVLTAALQSVAPHRTGSAAGVFSMSRYVGSITTSVVVSVVVSADASGSRLVIGLACASMVVALAVATALPRTRAAGS